MKISCRCKTIVLGFQAVFVVRKHLLKKRMFSFGHCPNYLSMQKNTNLNAILRTKVTFEKLLP